MRCLLLVSLLSAVSAVELPTPEPFDGLSREDDDALFGREDAPDHSDEVPSPLSDQEIPLNLTAEDLSQLYVDAPLNLTVDGLPLLEGDIVLTAEQRLSRKGRITHTWPGGIVPYVITSSSRRDRNAILAGIRHWQSYTCVRFYEKPESYRSAPHLRFIKSRGCWSYVGRINSRSGQSISIGAGCTGLGIVAHEIGHALGFWHEQSRRDRDSYISVLTENIEPSYVHNFRTEPTERSLGVPYDLDSVMHYGGFSFSKNDKPTIVTNDIRLSGIIGNRNSLSHRDKQLANLMYKCDQRCKCPAICRNGGYLDRYCRCRCPRGTRGTNCEYITGTYYEAPCGDQDITRAGTITSPRYPSVYPPGKHCVWIVTAPLGKRVRIQFGAFKVFFRYMNRCPFDWVTLHLDSDSRPEYVKCGTELQNKIYTSEGNRLALELHSYRRTYTSYQKGFTARVSFV